MNSIQPILVRLEPRDIAQIVAETACYFRGRHQCAEHVPRAFQLARKCARRGFSILKTGAECRPPASPWRSAVNSWIASRIHSSEVWLLDGMNSISSWASDRGPLPSSSPSRANGNRP